MRLKGELKKVKLSQVVANDWNANSIEPEDYAKLKRSLLAEGFVIPLICRKYDKNKYQILDGEHRWKAANELKEWKEIEILDLGKVDDKDARMITFRMGLKGLLDQHKAADVVRQLLIDSDIQDLIDNLPMTEARILEISTELNFDWDSYNSEYIPPTEIEHEPRVTFMDAFGVARVPPELAALLRKTFIIEGQPPLEAITEIAKEICQNE